MTRDTLQSVLLTLATTLPLWSTYAVMALGGLAVLFLTAWWEMR